MVENDIRSVDNVSRDVDKVKLFLHSYARNISTECSVEKILSDVNDNNPKGISDETVNPISRHLKNSMSSKISKPGVRI